MMLWTQVGVHHHNSLLALAENTASIRSTHIAWHATERRLTPWKAALKHVAP